MKSKATKIIAAISLILSFAIYVNGQEKSNLVKGHLPQKQILHIGDKIPDTYFQVSNYKDKSIKLSDLKTKLIILDLWGTYCGSCIEAMPAIEQLQNQFKDSVQVIMVTKNSSEEVRKCALKSENVRNNHLPFVNGKENLAGLFDLSFVPQYVWIDRSGIIKYISEEADVTSQNIKAFIRGDQLNINVKISIPNPGEDEPYLTKMYPYLKDEPYIYSYLAPINYNKYTTGSSESIGLDRVSHRFVRSNSFNFKSLYKMAYGFSDSNNPISNDRVILNFKDAANYADLSKGYIYEVAVNKNVSKKGVLMYIQAECNLFFNVSSKLEMRSVTCLILKRIDNGRTCLTSKPDSNVYEKVNNQLLKASMPWGRFFEWTNGVFILPPHTMIDETGIDPSKIIELKMSLDFNNLEEVRKSLAPYGLTINEEKKQEVCIVISDLE
jgi:thiol-disulfide isomerase/thioredoxin